MSASARPKQSKFDVACWTQTLKHDSFGRRDAAFALVLVHVCTPTTTFTDVAIVLSDFLEFRVLVAVYCSICSSERISDARTRDRVDSCFSVSTVSSWFHGTRHCCNSCGVFCTTGRWIASSSRQSDPEAECGRCLKCDEYVLRSRAVNLLDPPIVEEFGDITFQDRFRECTVTRLWVNSILMSRTSTISWMASSPTRSEQVAANVDNLSDEEFAHALVPLNSAISQWALQCNEMIKCPRTSAHSKRNAASFILGSSTGGRTTLFPFPRHSVRARQDCGNQERLVFSSSPATWFAWRQGIAASHHSKRRRSSEWPRSTIQMAHEIVARDCREPWVHVQGCDRLPPRVHTRVCGGEALRILLSKMVSCNRCWLHHCGSRKESLRKPDAMVMQERQESA